MARTEAARPFGAFERLLVRRFLAGRREGFISVIAIFSLVGIALGVGTLIVVMSVMNGFRAQLVERILGVNPHVAVFLDGGTFEDAASLALRIEGVEGVRRAVPLTERQVLASLGNRSAGALVRGLPAQELARLPAVAAPELSMGSIDDFAAGEGIALGDGLADRLRAGVGDSVTLLWPEGDRTPLGLLPRVRSYPVVYVFKIGMSHLDRTLAFMPLDEARRFFGVERPDRIEVTLDRPEAAPELGARILAAEPAVRYNTWMSSNGAFLEALAVERNVMFLILTLIVLVAALNIVSGMIMLVKEKVSSIAILRTMGAGSGSVMRVFFLCGASIGVAGTVLGVVLGVVFCLNIEALQDAVSYLAGTEVFSPDVYYLSRLPAELFWEDVAAIAGMSLSLSLLATAYPAWRAARTDPVEALRRA